MEEANEIQLYIKPKCTSFGFVVKRKICAAFIPFVIMLALHTVVQMILFWTTAVETPFLTAPLFMLLFFIYCGAVFNHKIEDKYGVTRTQNFLSSYTVAAIFSLAAVLLTLGLAELCHFFKHSDRYDLSFFVTAGDSAINFFYGFVTCLLMYPLSDIFLHRRQSGYLFFAILCGVLMLAIPLVCTGMNEGGLFFEYGSLIDLRITALAAFVFCLIAACCIDFVLLRRGIVR